MLIRSVICLIGILLTQVEFTVSHAGWNYFNTKNWPSSCRNTSNDQSPIHLKTPANNTKCSSYNDIKFGRGWRRTAKFWVNNNGHTVDFEVSSKAKNMYVDEKLDYQEIYRSWWHYSSKWMVRRRYYQVVSLHMHWGGRNAVDQGLGSEHRINDEPTVMEMHIVCYNTEYGYEKAKKKHDGFLVLAILYKIGPTSSPALEHIISTIDKVRLVKAKEMTEFRLRDLLPRHKRFYIYEGSFTTPNCNVAVLWHVFRDVQLVTRDQIRRLHEVTGTKFNSATGNSRPIQPRTGRHLKCTRD